MGHNDLSVKGTDADIPESKNCHDVMRHTPFKGSVHPPVKTLYTAQNCGYVKVQQSPRVLLERGELIPKLPLVRDRCTHIHHVVTVS